MEGEASPDANSRGQSAGDADGPARISARLDVLVEAEEVGRVVDPLESREPLVVALAVGLAHAVLALVAEEVDVDASARVGLQRVEEVACPGDVAVGLGIVLGPDRVDDDVVRGVPLAEGGRVLGNAGERAAELEDDACTSLAT